MTREDFTPENIGKLLYSEHPGDIISVGSYAWFHGIIDDFKPKDYDYIVMYKSDHNEIMKYHYMYCDYWLVYFNENQTVDDFIRFILESADEYRSVIYKLVNKNKNPYFNITYKDIEPYLDVIREKMEYCSSLLPKLKYYEKILDFIVENKSLTITEQQTKEVYQVYLENKNKRYPKGIEVEKILNS